MKKILLFGAVPPPIGGISVHVKRFVDYSSLNLKFDVKVFDLKKRRLFSRTGLVGGLSPALKFFFSAEVVHIHVSNSYIKVCLALAARVFFKKVVYTHHNSVVSNRFVFWIMFCLCNQVILVNDKNIEKEILINKSYNLIPAFVPPVRCEKLNIDITGKLELFDYVVSTNCFSGSLIGDRHLYGFDLLLEAIRYMGVSDRLEGFLFVFADPNRGMLKTVQNFLELYPSLHRHILYIDSAIDFTSLVKLSDVTVRATLTDGDSLSVRESLYFNVPVVASDVCFRPEGTTIFKSNDCVSLAENIYRAAKCRYEGLPQQKSYADDVLEVYSELISS